jgi:hypothetical protein
VSIALGVVLAIRPDLGAVTLATAFGLFSIVRGVQALALSVAARRIGAAERRLASAVRTELSTIPEPAVHKGHADSHATGAST